MDVKKEDRKKIQVARELVGFIKEIVALAKKIENHKPPNPDKCLDDKVYFYYNFLRRLVDYGNSVVILVRGKHTHAAVLVARTAFEGLVYVESYRKFYESLEKKWCYYAIYEAYREEYEHNSKTSADIWLRNYELQHGTDIVQKATEAFVFEERRQDWYQNLGRFSNLAERLANCGDPDLARMEQAKRELYDPFSKVTHWTPKGIFGQDKETFTLAAIALTFESLVGVSKVVNDECKLDFSEKLEDVWNRYQRYSRATLARIAI
ncbi:MAG: DUF5677 domain-containing protein [Halobacteriota archaeon]|jgi:hypothetical protein